MPADRLPPIQGTQIGLKFPDQVDIIKADMKEGRFDFQALRARIGGVRDRQGVYHVIDGHHRMVAAIELMRETADTLAVHELLRWGYFAEEQPTPIDSRPLPFRDWWGWLRNWFGW